MPHKWIMLSLSVTPHPCGLGFGLRTTLPVSQSNCQSQSPLCSASSDICPSVYLSLWNTAYLAAYPSTVVLSFSSHCMLVCAFSPPPFFFSSSFLFLLLLSFSFFLFSLFLPSFLFFVIFLHFFLLDKVLLYLKERRHTVPNKRCLILKIWHIIDNKILIELIEGITCWTLSDVLPLAPNIKGGSSTLYALL